MNIQKSLLVAGAVTGIGLAGITGLGVASAATSSSGHQGGIIDKIATKFNLNARDVAAVFEEDRAEHEAERQQRLEDRLTKAAQEGKITEEQKQKILAKQAELRAKMESMRAELKDKTPQERHKLLQQHHEELQKWAEGNNIPLKYLRFGMRIHHHPGPNMDGPKTEIMMEAPAE